MAVITVSKELAALGDESAREIAKLSGYRLVDKQVLEDRMGRNGLEAENFKKYDERKPSFLASLLDDREYYIHYLRKAVFDEAQIGDCVIVGRGANAILKGLPALISVFLSAPVAVRIERVKSYFHCDEKRAEQIIEHSDRDKAGFHRSFFDIDWRHPVNYHLSFNTGLLTPGDCAEIVNSFKDRVFTQEAQAGNAVMLKNILLSHKIEHSILYEQELPVRFIDVSVCESTAVVYGIVASGNLVDAVVSAAKEAAGEGIDVRAEIQILG